MNTQPQYFSTKTYGHDIGLSACFRQPDATSHCRFLHGYSLGFKFTFACNELDEKNWVMDFGGLKDLKKWLEVKFDHKVVLDQNDPKMDVFEQLVDHGVVELTIFDGVGVEKFAEHAWHKAEALVNAATNGRVWCVSAECSEHGSNSAIYKGQ